MLAGDQFGGDVGYRLVVAMTVEMDGEIQQGVARDDHSAGKDRHWRR